MRKLSFLKVISISALLVFNACGGGGGGGGSGNQSNGGSRPETGVRIIHASIDSAPLDFFIPAKNSSAVGRASFSKSTGYFSLSSDPQTLTLSKANIPESVFFSDNVTFEKGAVRSLLIYGDHATTGVKEAYIDDPMPDFDQSQAAVRFISAVVGAGSIATSVGGVVISENIAFGTASSYGFVPPGALQVRARRVADGAVLVSNTYTLEAGKRYTVVVSGETGYLIVGELLTD